MLDKVTSYAPMALVGFMLLSHALAFLAQVLKDLHKDQPGWIDSVSSVIGKAIDFLNGVKAPKV